MEITKERAREILKQYNSKDKDNHDNHALFNWCEEYKSFIGDNVAGCLSMEVEFILNSADEENKPFSRDDIDFFDSDKAREHLLYKFDYLSEEEQNEFMEHLNTTYNRRIKNKGDVEVCLNSLGKEDLRQLFNKLDLDEYDAHAEVFEWWIISEQLRYRLEQEGEIFLKGGCVDIWGRTTTGQAIMLDYCCIDAFINMLKDYAE